MSLAGLGPALFFSTLVIAGLVSYKRKRFTRLSAEEKEQFWERERKANLTRRKEISQLDYIKIPVNELPFVQTDNSDINSYQKQLKALSEVRILNLSGMSNTDLKLEYGVANINLLSQYDENCITLYMVLANLGAHLSKNGFHKEAIAFLEFGIACNTDVSRNYYVLADEYLAAHMPEKLDNLIDQAKQIKTMMGPSILKTLEEKRAQLETNSEN